MLSAVLGILGLLGLVYFGIIVVYSGIETSMSWFWLVFAAFCFFLAWGDGYYHRHRKQIPLWLPVSIATCCITAAVVLVILQVLIFGGMFSQTPDHMDYLIILGARVREDDISTSLKRRLDKALQYAQEHPETKLVLSGGQGSDEPTSEAQAMAEYLQYNGVDPEQLLLEAASTSTKENLTYSKALIEDQRKKEKEKVQEARIRGEVRRMELAWFIRKAEQEAREQGVYRNGKDFHGPVNEIRHIELVEVRQPVAAVMELLPDKPLEIGILTSNFHLFRALKIGEQCGFSHLYGVPSSSDPILFIHMCVRESFAILKDKFMGNM